MSSTSGVPRLGGGLVRLRAPDAADSVALAEQFADPATRRWGAIRPAPGVASALGRVREMTLGWERPGGPWAWAIDRVDGAPRYAGYIELSPKGAGTAEVDYGLHPSARGHHVMSSALRLVCRWWFDRGGRQVTWWAEAGHLESWRVARACGFTFQGTTLAYLPPPDGPVVGWVAALDRHDDLTRPSPGSPAFPGTAFADSRPPLPLTGTSL